MLVNEKDSALQERQAKKSTSESEGGYMAKNLKLKAARAEKDLTQGLLAQAVGVSRQTINAIEKGEYNPTINLCRAICKVLGKTLNDLFWEE